MIDTETVIMVQIADRAWTLEALHCARMPALMIFPYYDLKYSLRGESQTAGNVRQTFARLKASSDHFISILCLFEGEDAAELKQPV